MANFNEIITFLDATLHEKPSADSSINGLQIDAATQNIKRVGYAVDSGLSIIQQAIAKKVDLLIAHHGVFWHGSTYPIVGAFGEKVRLLIDNHCSLYASHLPLDGHPTLGNGAQIADFLSLKNKKPYMLYKDLFVGAQGQFKKPVSISEICEKLAALPGANTPLVLPFGKQKILSVAIVTGSGSFAVEQCAKDGIDLLISGEPKQQAYHEAKELGLSVIFAGHYATETVGVKAVAELVAKKFKINSVFIHEPTGI